MSAKDTLEKVITSVPIDSTAARVTSRGISYENPKKPNGFHSDVPPPMRPWKAPNAPDLTGRRIGRLTVVGYSGKLSSGQKANWVVRCDCGDYEIRKAKAINNPENRGDRCCKCQHFTFQKKERAWRREGVELDTRDL